MKILISIHNWNDFFKNQTEEQDLFLKIIS